MRRRSPLRYVCAAAFVATAITACQAATPAVSPEGLAVQVSDRPAPFSARPLGPVTATSGRGCGISGEQGSREKATALLREEVASEGGDYVQITSVVTPHVENGCYANQFVLRGLAWRVAPGPLSVPVESPAPALAESAPPAAAPSCEPPCGAGYACVESTCRAVCSPPCGPTETCAEDRVCRPAPPAQDAGLTGAGLTGAGLAGPSR